MRAAKAIQNHQSRIFKWRTGTKCKDVEFSFLEARDVIRPSKTTPTIVLLPSLDLLSSKEEWRKASLALSSMGAHSIILEWPGYCLNQPEVNEYFVTIGKEQPPVDLLTEYLTQCLDYFHSECVSISSPLYIAAAGGAASIHASRAIMNSSVTAGLISVAPVHKHNLRKLIGDDMPVRFERWQRRMLRYLPSILESRLGQRMYLSMRLLDKMCHRYFVEPVHSHAQRAITKQVALRRPGCPLDLHIAMITSSLDPTSSARSLVSELLQVKYGTSGECDTDDEDDLLLFGHRLPANSAPVRSDIKPNLSLILPSDCIDKQDLSELARLKEAALIAGVDTFSVPGRLSCHEEYSEATAAVLSSII